MPMAEFISGIVVGLIAAPLLFLVIGMFGYSRRTKAQTKETREMRENHAKEIKKIRKEYEKKHLKYMKLRTKVLKFVDTKLGDAPKGVDD